MVQYFQLVAPHIREVLGRNTDSFYNAIGDSTGSLLVNVLAVPFKHRFLPEPAPSRPHQFVTIAEHAVAQEDKGCNITAAIGVKRKDKTQATKCRRKFQRKTLTDCGEYALGLSHHQPATTLPVLPTELLILIFSHLEDMEEVVCLGLVSRRFCEIAREEIGIRLNMFYGSWAGEKIVFAGSYTESFDWPPGLFSDEEVEGLGQERIDFTGNGYEEGIKHPP